MSLFSTLSATHWEGKFLRTSSASSSLGLRWTTNRFRAAVGNASAIPSSDTATASSFSGCELTTTTFLPLSACRSASDKLRVVFPTPPFPQKMIILDCGCISGQVLVEQAFLPATSAFVPTFLCSARALCPTVSVRRGRDRRHLDQPVLE